MSYQYYTLDSVARFSVRVVRDTSSCRSGNGAFGLGLTGWDVLLVRSDGKERARRGGRAGVCDPDAAHLDDLAPWHPSVVGGGTRPGRRTERLTEGE